MTAPVRNRRLLIGSANRIGTRERFYLVADGIEIDEIDHYEINRRRIFFDEIRFVTYHRRFGVPFLAFTGLFAGAFLVATMAMGFGGSPEAAVFTGILAAPFLVSFVLRLIYRLDVITVHGKRIRAQIPFGIKKRQARQLLAEITNRTRQAQRKIAAEIAAETKSLTAAGIPAGVLSPPEDFAHPPEAPESEEPPANLPAAAPLPPE